MPFCLVMRPTKTTDGRSGSMPRRARESEPGSGWYSSGSMPLGITTTRDGSTAGYVARMSARMPAETATTASADWMAVRSHHDDRA
jgi:hypothetical protein